MGKSGGLHWVTAGAPDAAEAGRGGETAHCQE